jgi:hypothetical protein
LLFIGHGRKAVKIAFFVLMTAAMLAIGGPLYAGPKREKNSTYYVETGNGGRQSLGGRGRANGLERARQNDSAVQSLEKPGGKG